ncbi:hypothetical protein CALVIDRAFT_429618 [Calocera viscosa TUFC12733]|uniref:Uncharacterized protein n=1 Tax=Calocera viscosa (strain TUFC12733) TaxID=1330018 RepID=A0A167PMR8_CALVF|nr:hypothetical protein CALVIDRAFT_429618 [Calocera viscosa TUFC12733]
MASIDRIRSHAQSMPAWPDMAYFVLRAFYLPIIVPLCASLMVCGSACCLCEARAAVPSIRPRQKPSGWARKCNGGDGTTPEKAKRRAEHVSPNEQLQPCGARFWRPLLLRTAHGEWYGAGAAYGRCGRSGACSIMPAFGGQGITCYGKTRRRRRAGVGVGVRAYLHTFRPLPL